MNKSHNNTPEISKKSCIVYRHKRILIRYVFYSPQGNQRQCKNKKPPINTCVNMYWPLNLF